MPNREVQHNTLEQVEAIVEESLAVADRLELSEADRAVLLPKIVELVGAKTVLIEQAAPVAGLDLSRLGLGR